MDGESHSTVWSKLGAFFSGKSSEDHLEQAIREAREDGWLCDDSRIKGELEFEYTNQGNHKVTKAVINLQPDISPDKLTEYINRKALLTKCSKDIDGYYDQIKQLGKNNKATEEFYNKIQEWLKDPRVLESTTESVIHATCTNSVKYFYKILTQLFVC